MSAITWDFGKPSVKQDQLMRMKQKILGYGGARAGGKSWLVRKRVIFRSLIYPGMKSLIIRATYPELLHNHIEPITAQTRQFAKYNTQEKVLRFPNGSKIDFGYCKNETDMQRYQGGEWDEIYIDEAGNISEQCIKMFIPCIRGVNGLPKHMILTFNPGGKSHAYLKRVFVDRHFNEDENPEDYAFVQALIQDNKALMDKQPDYIKNLEVLPERLKRAWLYGEWDVFAGQFFEEYIDTEREDRKWTHVIPAFEPHAHWKIWRTYDYGYNHPFACQWWAIDTDGIMYLIAEWYGCGKEPNTGLHLSADAQFSEIARIEREHPYLRNRKILGLADPAIWSKESTGYSVADAAAKQGVYFSPANNDRINGWAQCHNRLAFDEHGRPGMYVFSHCHGFRRTIPTLLYSETRPEDLDTDGEDHEADAWRYLCMANPIKAPVPVEKKIVVPYMDPLEINKGIWRR